MIKKKRDIDQIIQATIQHYQQNNFDQVEIEINNILKTEPNNAFALFFRGIMFASKKEYEKAIYYYDESIKSKSDYVAPWYNKGNACRQLGRLDQAISSYDHTIKLEPRYLDAWFNKANIFVELKSFEKAIVCYDEVIKLNPNFIPAWLNKGNAFLELKFLQEAISHFNEVIRLNPDNADAWYNKAKASYELGIYREAIIYFDKALEIKSDDVATLSAKGNTLVALRLLDEAIALYDRAIKLDPNYAIAWCNKGFALQEFKQYDEAITCFDEAIKLDPNYWQPYINKAYIKLMQEKFEDGWKLHEYRWKETKYRYNNYPPLTSLNNISDKNILVWHEQGMGDVLNFSRYVTELINLKAVVTFEVQKDLINIFHNQFNCQITEKVEKNIKFDFQIPLMSIPKLFNTNSKNIPKMNKIKIDYENVHYHKLKLKLSTDKPNIGIAVSGNPKNKLNQKRSIPIKYFKQLLNYGNFFLIQKDISQDDMNFLKEHKEINIVDKQINNFLDTGSIVQNMDFIISVDTSLIHLAGLLNKKSFLMLGYSSDWRWFLNRSDSLWYPSIKIFRQKHLDNWESVINEIDVEMKNKYV